MPSRRRAPHNQAAVRRLLELRKIDGFEAADLAELSALAENVGEETFAPGALVVSTLARAGAIHIVLEGRLTAASGRTWGPGEVCGSLEAIGRRRMTEDVFADTTTRTLQLSAGAFREILEDNYGLLTSVRRALGRQLQALPIPPDAIALPELSNDGHLGMVERLILLRKRMPFGKGRIEALAALAQASEEVRLPVSSELAIAGELPTATLVLLEGSARLMRDGAAVMVGPGYALGALEALSERPFASTVVALEPIRALRCPTSALFDVLEDHTDLALAMVEALATALVAVPRGATDRHELN